MGCCCSKRSRDFNVKDISCWEYFTSSICLSFYMPFFDYCINESCFYLNGGYIPEDEETESPLPNQAPGIWYTALADCVWNLIMELVYCCMGKPDIPVWDYKDEQTPIGDVKRAGTISATTEEQGYLNLYEMLENGDVVQIGFCDKDICDETTQAITRSNLVHCLIAIDMKWLETGELGGPIKLFQATLNGMRNGVGGNDFLEAMKQYQIFKDDSAPSYMFLLKLKESAREVFNKHYLDVSKFLYDFTDFNKCGSMTDHRYSMSTIVRDLCILTWMTRCYKTEEVDVVEGFKTSHESPVVYQRTKKKYINFKDDPNCFDIFVSNILNMRHPSPGYVACAKFTGLVHQVGGLISPGANLSHVSNESNCWPDYWKEYYNIKIPPFIGTCWKSEEYRQYLNNFSLLSSEEYEDAMNRYFFDVNDYIRNRRSCENSNDERSFSGLEDDSFLYQNSWVESEDGGENEQYVMAQRGNENIPLVSEKNMEGEGDQISPVEYSQELGSSQYDTYVEPVWNGNVDDH